MQKCELCGNLDLSKTGGKAVEWTTCELLGGAIRSVTLSGPVTTDEMLAMMARSVETVDLSVSRGLLVDLSEADGSGVPYEELRRLSEERNTLRDSYGDARPTAVIAPTPLALGLVNTVAAFDSESIQAFETRDAALVWLLGEMGLDVPPDIRDL